MAKTVFINYTQAITEPQDDVLRQIAYQTRISKNELVRRAINNMFMGKSQEELDALMEVLKGEQ